MVRANNVFQLKRTTVTTRIPTTSDISTGELGVNLTDEILYCSDGSLVFPIGANNVNTSITNTLTVGGVAVSNSSGVFIGPNVDLTTSTLFIGNSTVNTTITAGDIKLNKLDVPSSEYAYLHFAAGGLL